MSSELDLVRNYMNADNVSPDELSVARSILEDAISAEVELDRPSDRPALPEIGDRRRSHRLARWSVVVTVAAAAIAILILQVIPTSKVTTSDAAAAVISRLADAVQPVPPLLAGEWNQYQLRGVLSIDVNTVGKTPTPNASASIPISIGAWSNSTSVLCTSQQFGTATFAGPVNAQAWRAIGLLDTPANQPVTGCLAQLWASIATGGSSLETIDVSTITHDPATLATQLEDGTTGIQSIDRQYAGYEPANVASFVRLTALLVGPTSGQWSGFGQEVLKTMALIPGVISLGSMTSHSGADGLAFTTRADVTLNPMTGAESSYSSPPPTVILDPSNGALLEARNFDVPRLPQPVSQDFVNGPSAPVSTQGVTFGVTTQWIDPVAAPGVIQRDALPAWVKTFHVIRATTIGSATDLQVSAVIDRLPRSASGFRDDSAPGPGETFWFAIAGTAADEAMVSTLRASGVFASISVLL